MTKLVLRSVIAQILLEYKIRMTSEELKILVEERMRREVPMDIWNNIIKEITQDTGMIDQ